MDPCNPSDCNPLNNLFSDEDISDEDTSDEIFQVLDESSSAVVVLLHLATGLDRWASDHRPLEIEGVRDLLDALRTSMDEKLYFEGHLLNTGVLSSIFKSFEEIVFHSNEHFLGISLTNEIQPLIRNIITPSRYVAILLQCALENNIPNILPLFAAHNIDIVAADSFGITPLMWACGAAFYGNRERVETSYHFPPRPGNTALVRLLLNLDLHADTGTETDAHTIHDSTHTNINATDEEAMSALMYASVANHVEVMRILMQAGASLTCECSWGDAALTLATCFGNLEAVGILLNSGANTEHRDQYNHTPLVNAIIYGHPEIFFKLLGTGSALRQRHYHARTSLHLAARSGNTQLLRMFLPDSGLFPESNVDDRDKSGQTALIFAAMYGRLECVKILLDAKADVNGQDREGLTPLSWAGMFGKIPVMKELIRRGANVHLRDNVGQTALMHMSRGFGDNSAATIQVLMDAGLDLEDVDDFGRTALICAVGKHVSQNVISLLRARARVDVEMDGKTVLELIMHAQLDTALQPLLETTQMQFYGTGTDMDKDACTDQGTCEDKKGGDAGTGTGTRTGTGKEGDDDNDDVGDVARGSSGSGVASLGDVSGTSADGSVSARDVAGAAVDTGVGADVGTNAPTQDMAVTSSPVAAPSTGSESVSILDVAQYTKMVALMLLRVYHVCRGHRQAITSANTGTGTGTAMSTVVGKSTGRKDWSSVDVARLIAALFGILDDVSHSRNFPSSFLAALHGNSGNPDFLAPECIPDVDRSNYEDGDGDGAGDGGVSCGVSGLSLSRAYRAIADQYRVLVADGDGGGGGGGAGGSGAVSDGGGRVVLRAVTEAVLALVCAAVPCPEESDGAATAAATATDTVAATAVVHAAVAATAGAGAVSEFISDDTDGASSGNADSEVDVDCRDLTIGKVRGDGGADGVLSRAEDVVGHGDVTLTRYLAFLLHSAYLCHRQYGMGTGTGAGKGGDTGSSTGTGTGMGMGTSMRANSGNNVDVALKMDIVTVLRSLYRCLCRHVEGEKEEDDEDEEGGYGDEGKEEEVEAEVDVDMQDERGRTVLMWVATMALQPHTRNWHFRNPDFRNPDSRNKDLVRVLSPPFPSTYRISTPLLRALIRAGADMNARDSDGKTALMYACMYNHICMVNELIASGTNANICDKGGATALMYACKYHSIEAVHTLCMVCARTTLVDDSGHSALMYAALSGCKEAFQEIVAVKTDLPSNVDDGTPQMLLFCAIKGGNVDIVRACLPAVLTVINDGDEDGKTALDIALMMNNSEIVQFLVEAGANVSEQYEDQ